MKAAWEEAREKLESLTPLKSDCGRLCGARCCRSMEGEQTGMLLYPGEEDYYEDMDGWEILPAGRDLLIVCPGECDRADRPLSCRIFPLLPVPEEDGVKVRTDERARGICPLARHGKRGMDPAFAEAVREAGEILCADPAGKRMLERQKAEQAEWKELRKKLNG